MTIEELLGKSAAELCAMSDEEVRAFFAPYLVYIKPSKESIGVAAPAKYDKKTGSKMTNVNAAVDHSKELAKELAKKYGIDLNKI